MSLEKLHGQTMSQDPQNDQLRPAASHPIRLVSAPLPLWEVVAVKVTPGSALQKGVSQNGVCLKKVFV